MGERVRAQGVGRLVKRSSLTRLAVAVLFAVLGIAGVTGVVQYARTYWLYRGFAPPNEPASVAVRSAHGVRFATVRRGTLVTLEVRSPALGNRPEPVLVYLPPGYFGHPDKSYPVLYLLHGTPGAPINFFRIADIGVLEDVMIAKREIEPMILVAPTGSPSVFADTEWVNGVRSDTGWETYVVRGVVTAVDRRFRTIRNGRGRAIAGLSEGGYGALDMAFHHPGEFDVVESWSGYEWADHVPGVFGAHERPAMLAYDSPAVQLRRRAAVLRQDHLFVWLYSGARDPLLVQNEHFATELTRYRIAHRFVIVPGGHDWKVWRSMAGESLLIASRHLGPATKATARGAGHG